MVESQSSKLIVRVRFPSLALNEIGPACFLGGADFIVGR
jgi:hypothetical protein